MHNPNDQLACNATEVQVQWDDARTARALAGAKRKRRTRQARWAGGMVVIATLGGAGLGALITDRWSHGQGFLPPADGTVHLTDGSTIVPLQPDTDVRVLDQSRKSVTVDLRRGGGRFDVVPNRLRAFQVRVGDIEVSVLGTLFEVQRELDHVRIAVLRGQVRVRSPRTSFELTAGEHATLSLSGDLLSATGPTATQDAIAAEVATNEDLAERPPAPRRKSRAIPQGEGAAWRSLVHAGDYEAAYDALKQEKRVHLDDSAVLLMEAADAARFSGHPQEAVGYLQRVLQRHSGDPMATLAAFTLGRVLLERLGDPRGAALAFARASGPGAPANLAEDALAREVEAWSKAGDASAARERASLYLRQYPQGRRAHTVRLFGGLE